ncbi:MAG: transporter substrate-binding domain-containing protein [Desulfobacterales bacterium]|nr:transporter substrate-binding domain-containing protein [Desulfobacterales bacterium]
MSFLRLYIFRFSLIFLTCWFLLLSPFTCSAASIGQVVSCSPSWQDFTNQDGTGLYHDILSAIFTAQNIKVSHKYTSAKRGLYMLQNNLADIYTCKDKNDDLPGLLLADYQMYEGIVYALFKKDRINDWQGIVSLSQKTAFWRRGYYKPEEFNVDLIPVETDSGVSALGQIILGRGDFYIDDLNLINESISNSIFPVERKTLRIEPVLKRTYHPVFNNSDRGKAIMALYEKGMKRLIRSGELENIFKKYNHPFPEYPRP